jgi:hypothetical protein
VPLPGSAGKINTREHQFKTGATRPRIIAMAIISAPLHIVEGHGLISQANYP